MLTWTGRAVHPNGGLVYWLQYTVWPDGDNHLSGAIGSRMLSYNGVVFNRNLAGNSVDLICETEVLPTVTWNLLLHGMILLHRASSLHLLIFRLVIHPDGNL